MRLTIGSIRTSFRNLKLSEPCDSPKGRESDDPKSLDYPMVKEEAHDDSMANSVLASPSSHDKQKLSDPIMDLDIPDAISVTSLHTNSENVSCPTPPRLDDPCAGLRLSLGSIFDSQSDPHIEEDEVEQSPTTSTTTTAISTNNGCSGSSVFQKSDESEQPSTCLYVPPISRRNGETYKQVINVSSNGNWVTVVEKPVGKQSPASRLSQQNEPLSANGPSYSNGCQSTVNPYYMTVPSPANSTSSWPYGQNTAQYGSYATYGDDGSNMCREQQFPAWHSSPAQSYPMFALSQADQCGPCERPSLWQHESLGWPKRTDHPRSSCYESAGSSESKRRSRPVIPFDQRYYLRGPPPSAGPPPLPPGRLPHFNNRSNYSRPAGRPVMHQDYGYLRAQCTLPPPPLPPPPPENDHRQQNCLARSKSGWSPPPRRPTRIYPEHAVMSSRRHY